MSNSKQDCIDKFLLSEYVQNYDEESLMSFEFISTVMTAWRIYVGGDSKKVHSYLQLSNIKNALLSNFSKDVAIYESEAPMVLSLIMQFYYFLKITKEISQVEYYQVMDLLQLITVQVINTMSDDARWSKEKLSELYGEEELEDEKGSYIKSDGNVISLINVDRCKDMDRPR